MHSAGIELMTTHLYLPVTLSDADAANARLRNMSGAQIEAWLEDRPSEIPGLGRALTWSADGGDVLSNIAFLLHSAREGDL